ncbi:unnamed protein product [Darwinula stevensoni]|uniref:Uncharacterized protein n=1 Tax=Darwinula stevensoni TaxID=69355 RepID=A0A7R9A708_9CRUS|nr:unnamed protein product [Darwinula stevensoni]CAG0890972.1 unnamed protein product [Darwinula stevensoni]
MCESLSPGNFSRAPYQPPPSSNEDEKRGKKRGTLRKIFRTLGRRDRDRGRRDRDRDRRDRDGEDPHPLSLPYEYNHSSHSQPTDDILDSSVAADPLITPAPPSLVLPPVPERRWYMESENRIPITEAIQRYKQIERQKRLDREARSDEIKNSEKESEVCVGETDASIYLSGSGLGLIGLAQVEGRMEWNVCTYVPRWFECEGLSRPCSKVSWPGSGRSPRPGPPIYPSSPHDDMDSSVLFCRFYR